MNEINLFTPSQTKEMAKKSVESELRDKDVIHYEVDELGCCITECPYGMTCGDLIPRDESLDDLKINVGSYACAECVHYVGKKCEEKIVHCSKKGRS